ncbi:SurA N-terminal domain-containing protein [Desulfovibrio sp. TomC]|uniref:SurA N-terminal domain-containing protein n=1 Tax=Desulfovibrio sp. TomC TaxID=1562888 RepID=UPI0005755F25|nr:SurA N-terminal domain-containing protein [Desulfovibrio sp. TomC]KHK01636.1 Peptidyl-prolyl cis-trans isomerase PpiD [Desulfovibrio sp. TomC]
MLDPMRRYAQSWGIKIVFGLIIIVFIFWGVGSTKGDKATVLATVDEQPILIKDYEKSYQENMRLVKNKNPNVTDKELQEGGFRWQVFSNMVTTKLLEAQAQKLGITIPTEELRAEIAKIPAFQNESKQFDPKRYENLLKANDIAPGEFEADFRQQLLLEKLAAMVGLPATVAESEARAIFDFMREQAVIHYIPFSAADFAKSVTISDEQIKTYYDARKDEFATPAQVKIDYVEFTPKGMAKPAEVTDADIEASYKANPKKYERPEQVRVRHILMILPADAPKEVVDAAEARLKAMADKVRQGADFATLIPKDPNNADGIIGEDWAWLPKGSLPKEFGPFEAKAFSLKKDEVSDPVRTSLGLHLIQGGEKQAGGQRSLAEVKDDIRAELAEQRAADKLTKALDAVQEKLASGESLEAAVADEKVAIKSSAFFAKETPPAELGLSEPAVTAIFALKKGQTADAPLSTQDGFLLVRAADVKEAGTEPLEAVKDVIKARLTDDEALKLAKAKADEAAKGMETEDGQKKILAQYKDKITLSAPFTRQGFIPALGMAPVLVQTTFEAKEPGWFKAAYGVSGAYVLAGLDKRIPAEAALWDKEKERWVATLTQSKQTELFRAYLQTLQQGAQVVVVNEDILGPRPKGAGGLPGDAGGK